MEEIDSKSLYSNAYVGDSIVFMEYEKDGVTILSVAQFFLGGFSVYYYIILIIQFYFLLPILQKLVLKPYGIWCSLLISICTTIVIEYVMVFQGKTLPLLIYATPFPFHLIYFVLGMAIAYSEEKRIRALLIFLIVVTAIFYFASVLETQFAINLSGIIPQTGIRVSASFYSIYLICFLFSLKKYYRSNIITNLIVRVGDCSFGIYLIHMYIITFLIRKLELNWFFEILTILVITMVIIYFAKKTLPTFSRKYLGF